MHIADITAFYARESGGVKRYLHAKRDWLARHRAFRHTLVVPGPRHTVAPPGTLYLPSIPLPNSAGYRLPAGRWKAREVLLAAKPDVIEAGDPYFYASAAVDAALDLGIPALAFCHSDIHTLVRRWLGALPAQAVARYLRWMYARFDRVLAASNVVLEHLIEIGVSNAARQPLGVDTAVFHPNRRDEELRSRLGIAPNSRLLVFAGRFAAEKNLWVLEQAVRTLGPPYVLLAIGSGPHPPRGTNVIILPFQADASALAALLASADALVHAGDQETFGLIVLEAMACGIPVIGPDAGGVRELIDDAVGLRVRPKDPAALAAAIDSLFSADLTHLGGAARARVVRHYDWDVVMPNIIAHYRAAQHRRTAPRLDVPPVREWGKP
ncbi:MAG TPA: glycosyltransferase [Burkholderiales bacterium]|nr:glycosyltransferase [Burkholderiales bacterium]